MSIQEGDANLVAWSWHIPQVASAATSRTPHRTGVAASRVANHINSYITFDHDERTISYQPGGDSDVTTVVRTSQKVPHFEPVYLFEVEVVSCRLSAPTSRIAIGVVFAESDLTRLPGIENNSLAVHSDTGMLHTKSTEGSPHFYFSTGDIVSVSINFVTDSITLFKNGMGRGVVLAGIPEGASVYPVIGFDYSDATVRVNFGQQRFRYPQVRETVKAEVLDYVMGSIARTPLFPLDGNDDQSLVLKASSKQPDENSKANAGGNTELKNNSIRRELQSGEVTLDVSIPPEAGGVSAAALRTANQAHTTMLRAILDFMLHSGCSKTAQEISHVLNQRASKLSAAVVHAALPLVPGTYSSDNSSDDTVMASEDATHSAPEVPTAQYEISEKLVFQMNKRRAVIHLVMQGSINQV